MQSAPCESVGRPIAQHYTGHGALTIALELTVIDMDGSNREMAHEQEPGRSRRSRLRLLVDVLNVVAFVALIMTFLVYAVERRLPPIYKWVHDTPVEHFCTSIAATVWTRKGELENRVMDSPLLPEEELQAAALRAEMMRIRPSHVIALTTGQRIFGNERRLDDGRVQLMTYDGRAFRSQFIDKHDIAMRKVLVHSSDDRLSAGDVRFLLDYPELNPYLIPPHLFAAGSGFDRVFSIHMILSSLEDEFRTEFTPFVSDNDDGRRVQICFFANEQDFHRETARQQREHLLNSVGFFSESQRRLYFYDPGSGSGQQTNVTVVRHEGAHELATAYGIFSGLSETPHWLAEGIAQYCETIPFGALDADNITVLRRAQQAGTLIPWAVLMADVRGKAVFLPPDSRRLAYAQAWWLFRHLMQRRYQSRFFRFLLTADNETLGSDADNTRFMNALEIPSTTLFNELETQLMQ